jgi:hypothetical protein
MTVLWFVPYTSIIYINTYIKLSLEVHACILSSTVSVFISNTWTPFLCYVSSHSKVSHSASTNSMHWSPSFTTWSRSSIPFMEANFCVTRACPWSLPCARWIHSYHPICFRVIRLLLPHLFLNHTSVHLLSEFLAWVFFILLVYHACWVLCPSYPAFAHHNCILHPSSVPNKILLTFMNLPHASYILSPVSSSFGSP